MLDRRTFLSCLTGAGLIAGLSSCANDTNSYTGADAVPVSWIRYHIAQPKAIDPALVQDEAGRTVVSQLFDTLLRFDFATSTLVPLASSSYEVSDDAKTFTFHLVADATFHNGDAVTASSFKNAWERIVRPDLSGLDAQAKDSEDSDSQLDAAPLLSLIKGFAEMTAHEASELVGLRCPDDNTLVVELTEPCADWAYATACPALSPVPQAALDDPKAFGESPVGNGAFKMKKAWDGEGDIRLTANRHYIAQKPAVEGVLFAVKNKTTDAYKQFEAGNIDVCEIPVDQTDSAKKSYGEAADSLTLDEATHVIKTSTPSLVYLLCNPAHSVLEQADARKAVSCAIDREALCVKTLKSSHREASSLVPSCISSNEALTWSICTFDPDHAAELLEPNYPLDSSNKRDIHLTLLYRAGGVLKHVAEHIAADLKAAGITLDTKELKQEELLKRIADGEFDIALTSFVPATYSLGSYAALADVSAQITASSSISSAAEASTSEESADTVQDAATPGAPSISELLAQAQTLTDEASRNSAYVQAIQQAAERMDLIPLVHPTRSYVATDRITHLSIDPDGTPRMIEAQKASV